MTENSVVQQYIDFWNAGSGAEQRELAATIFADRFSYHAPVGVMRELEQLITFREQFADQSPGYEFRPRSEPQAHHDRARLQWELLVDGTSFATGTDVLELGPDGRIVSITGFLDRAPEGFPHAGH
ncbi:nuclear transport factor 2 family protein [Kribbella sp. NPDC004138]